MKLTNAFSLLSTVLVFACYLEKIEPEKNSASSNNLSSNSLSPSSSSQVIEYQEPLLYQGQSYRTIKMGSLIWLAENLNAEPKSGNGNWWCNDNLLTRCEQYGKLYDWAAAMDACPSSLGWRLPSKKDYDDLSNFDNSVISNNNSWWNATFGGYKEENTGDKEGFSDLDAGYWWSSTEAANNLAGYSYIIGVGGKLEFSWKTKARAFSVRCVKNG